VRVPDEGEQAEIHERYVSELVPGVFRDETRDRLLAIAHHMVERDGIEALVLGGTELPLLLRGAPEPGIPYLDTAKIHVERAVAAMIED
jgi:aspartate racemase